MRRKSNVGGGCCDSQSGMSCCEPSCGCNHEWPQNNGCCGPSCGCDSCCTGRGTQGQSHVGVATAFVHSLKDSMSCGKPACDTEDGGCEEVEWVEDALFRFDPLWEGNVTNGTVSNGMILTSGMEPMVFTSPVIDLDEYDMYQVEMEAEGDNPELSWRHAKTAEGLLNQAFSSSTELHQNFRYAQFRAIVRPV